MTDRPLIVVHTGAALAEACADLAEVGWRVQPGWTVPGPPRPGPAWVSAAPTATTVFGAVAGEQDIGDAVLAALTGAGVVADAGPGRRIAELLCDNLRRLGPVEHRWEAAGWVVLTADERRLLDLLAAGRTLGDAAKQLHLARRSADRRLAAARARLGVTTTTAAVRARAARLAALPRPVAD